MAWEKASNLRQLTEYGRQSKARNFETAQHIHKRLSYVSSLDETYDSRLWIC